MLRQKAGAAAFGEGDINERNDGAAQIEHSHEERRSKRNARDDRPVHHLFHFENRKAKTFAAGAENAVLTLGEALLGKNFAFEECAAIEFSGKRRIVAFKGHQANLFTALSNSSGVKGLVT